MSKTIVSFAMLRLLFLSLVLGAAFASPAFGEESPEEIAALKKRLAILEAQVSLLNKECTELRAENAALKAKASGEKADTPNAGKVDASGDEKVSRAAPAGTPQQPAAKAFVSALDMLNNVPADLRPTSGGTWDKFARPKVHAWIDKNVKGESVDLKLVVSGISVRQQPFQKDKDGNPLWAVTIDFDNDQYKYAAITVSQKIHDLVLVGDEKFAKRAEQRLTKGVKLRVKGKVHAAELFFWNDTKADMKLTLTETKFEPDILKP